MQISIRSLCYARQPILYWTNDLVCLVMVKSSFAIILTFSFFQSRWCLVIIRASSFCPSILRTRSLLNLRLTWRLSWEDQFFSTVQSSTRATEQWVTPPSVHINHFKHEKKLFFSILLLPVNLLLCLLSSYQSTRLLGHIRTPMPI